MSFMECDPGHAIIQHQFWSSTLLVWDRDRWRAYSIIRTPAWVQEVYDRVAAVSEIACKPRLLVLADAGGAGGFSYDGIVAVGMSDFNTLVADAYARGLLARLTPAEAVVRRHVDPAAVWTDDQVRRGMMTTLFGHELDHTRRRQLGLPYAGIWEEAACDEQAGIVDEHLGVPMALGIALMNVVGCCHFICDHPPAPERVRRYAIGRARETQARIALEEQRRWHAMFGGQWFVPSQ